MSGWKLNSFPAELQSAYFLLDDATKIRIFEESWSKEKAMAFLRNLVPSTRDKIIKRIDVSNCYACGRGSDLIDPLQAKLDKSIELQKVVSDDG